MGGRCVLRKTGSAVTARGEMWKPRRLKTTPTPHTTRQAAAVSPKRPPTRVSSQHAPPVPATPPSPSPFPFPFLSPPLSPRWPESNPTAQSAVTTCNAIRQLPRDKAAHERINPFLVAFHPQKPDLWRIQGAGPGGVDDRTGAGSVIGRSGPVDVDVGRVPGRVC